METLQKIGEQIEQMKKEMEQEAQEKETIAASTKNEDQKEAPKEESKKEGKEESKKEPEEQKKEKDKEEKKEQKDEMEIEIHTYVLEPPEEVKEDNKNKGGEKNANNLEASRKMYYGSSMTPKPQIRKLSAGSRKPQPLTIGVSQMQSIFRFVVDHHPARPHWLMC